MAAVGDDSVRAAEVDRLLQKITRGKKPHADLLPYIQAQLIEELIARRLVLAYAARNQESPAPEELQSARNEFQIQLRVQRRTLPDYLKTQGITQDDLERQLAWNVVWERYLVRYATDERVQSYFQSHRREFDGTELVVSHILLQPSLGAGPAGVEESMRRAEAIRGEITSGKLSFADAARKHSNGPSKRDGGRLGPIGRHGPMDEAFSRAAFALEPGQVSPAVKTAFGIHLIRCDESKPGTKQLAEVRKEVGDALARELLDKLAAIERNRTAVKYTGALPHFKPGTHELAPP